MATPPRTGPPSPQAVTAHEDSNKNSKTFKTFMPPPSGSPKGTGYARCLSPYSPRQQSPLPPGEG
ncbi:hypothetical protein GMSM_45560 [Geomonas sp. Red276]